MEVVATVVSPSFMQCYTPTNSDFEPATPYSVQEKTLEVSLNGVDWTASGKRFTYYDHDRIFVSLIEPEGGPLAGGTEIIVHGSSFRSSEHLRCTWDNNTDPLLKVVATYINHNTVRCIVPPIPAAGRRELELTLDDFYYTSSGRLWTSYDPGGLAVSAVDPIGGPVRGGTLIEVLGQGFAKLGGAEQHGLRTLPKDHPDAHRRIDPGVFCKFSLNGVRTPRGLEPWCGSQGTSPYQGPLDAASVPMEGAAALSRAASDRHLRNHSCFTQSTTPSLGSLSAVMQGTYLDEGRLLCKSPAFAGVLRNNRATLRIHVTLNGDFHDLGSISHSNASYTLYDPREARIGSMLRTGGPLSGSTLVVITGKLFYDFTLRAVPGRSHLLYCRFGFAGVVPATWRDETRVACYSPRIYGSGHRQVVSVDLTYNGQDYIDGANPQFTYSPIDRYQMNGTCRDVYGAAAMGQCQLNFTGIAVSGLQPFGGPRTGGTQVVVIGRLFAVQGPSVMCKFGNLSMVAATFLNESALLCLSPPNPHVLGAFEDHELEVTLNGEPNFLTASRVPYVYYDHNATLFVSSIYPQAGPKAGGNTITVYGAGFRALGGSLRRACESTNVTGTSSEELYGEDRTEGSLSRGAVKVLGDSRACTEPDMEGTNRGLQCLFGDMPPVHAYLLRLDGANPTAQPPAATSGGGADDGLVGSALICQLPALHLEVAVPHVPGDGARGLLPGSPHTICVDVTLNGERTAATTDCVAFTYYDT